jgi:molybdate transport system substrate-binding protein
MLSRPTCIQHFACLLLVILGIIPAKLSAADKPKQEILVAAAASLKDVFEEMGSAFEQKSPDTRVTFQFAASGALQQQIEQGAPVDVFVSAAQKQVDALLQKDLLIKDSVQVIMSNELVLIVRPDQVPPQRLADLKNPAYKRLALGESRTVPAGQYAEAWLQNMGLLEVLKPRLVPASNVRQVLTFVETGNVTAGFVYASDARSSSKVKVALRASKDQHPPIVYPLALVKRSQKQTVAQAFVKFLAGPEARSILLRHGFLLPAEKGS